MNFRNVVKSIVLTCLTVLSINVVSASHGEKKEFNVSETIMHHIGDAHEWHIMGGHEDAVSVPLPIILMDGGLKIFSSKHLYHGEVLPAIGENEEEITYVADVENGYAMFHEKIYKLNANGELNFHHGHPTNAKPLDLSITKNTLSLLIGATLLILLMSVVARFYKNNGAVAPKGLAKFIEPLIVFVRDDIAKANIGEHKYKKFTPFLLTIFFFILINNLLGLIPVFPGGANLTGNIAVTMVLAVASLFATVFSGNKNYWKHIFATPGVPIPLLIIMIPIEVVGIFTKPFALMIRLFANMTAGHIIILALISIIFINQSAWWGALSVPMALFISVLEILVAFLQAYLFAMLTSLFISAAVEEHHH
jgi:F-type H+-transporting ATPase subunit a